MGSELWNGPYMQEYGEKNVMETRIYCKVSESVGWYVPGTEGMDHEKACALAYWLNCWHDDEYNFSVVGGKQDKIDAARGRAWLNQYRESSDGI
jgi:hypothetical protein